MTIDITRAQMAELLQVRVIALERDIGAITHGLKTGEAGKWSKRQLASVLEAKSGSLFEVLQLARHLGIGVHTRVPLPERAAEQRYPGATLED